LKRVIVIVIFLTGIFGYSQDYAKGKQLFNQHCAACHKMDRKLVGPPLQDVIEAQGKDWTKKWIYNSKALIDAGDPHAVEIWEEYNRAAMPGYQFLKEEELDNVVEYLAQWKTKKAEAAAVIAPVATDGGQVVVNNSPPTPIYVYIFIVIMMVIVTVAIYAFYVGMKAITNVIGKTQSTNMYLMKKLHMDQEKVDGELHTLIESKVKKKVDKKLKQFKKDLNKRLRDLK
tara:strand:+ start:11901 stop:12587 length:687 start_codon:yes stop_codon:yes gene_type:complete